MKKQSITNHPQYAEIVEDIALHYGRTKGTMDIARAYKIEARFVGSIAFRLRELGIDVPKMRGKGSTLNMPALARDILKKHPELAKTTGVARTLPVKHWQ